MSTVLHATIDHNKNATTVLQIPNVFLKNPETLDDQRCRAIRRSTRTFEVSIYEHARMPATRLQTR